MAVQFVVLFLSALVFVLVFTEVSVRDRQGRLEVERLAAELAVANQRLQEYAAQAEELARTRERNRLAREIHDSLGHYLTVVNVQLEAAKALLESRGLKETAPELYSALDKAQNLTHAGLEDVRRSVAALRAGPAEEKPFLDRLEALIEECRGAGLVVHFERPKNLPPLAPQAELALFRALQEGLTNVRKHARASRVDVRLASGEKSVQLEVRDNGVGLNGKTEGSEKFGLLGLRERAELLQGRLSLEPNPGGGLRLELELPI